MRLNHHGNFKGQRFQLFEQIKKDVCAPSPTVHHLPLPIGMVKERNTFGLPKFSERNTFELPKFSKLSFAFNIFVPIPVQEVLYFKGYTKNHHNGRFCVGNHRSKNVSEKIWGGFSPPVFNAHD